MPEINYKVDLFYGDIGFTSDYANVLQFDDANARDTYFDNINDKDTFDNTDFNNIQLSGNTIKIAFVDATQITRLERYNYIRVLTTLYGSLDYVSKYDYGFIVDYTIISSNSNITVVEFTFETDLWQNFQFDFELKECNVERSHMDRWDNTQNIKYVAPNYDAYPAFAKVESIDIVEPLIKDDYNAVRITDSINMAFVTDASNLEWINRGKVGYPKIMWCLLTMVATQGTAPDRVVYTVFPVNVDKSNYEGRWEAVTNPQRRNSRIVNSIEINKAPSVGFDANYYPSLMDIENGNINKLAEKIKASIVNIQFLPVGSFRLVKFYEDLNTKDHYMNRIYSGDVLFENTVSEVVQAYYYDDNYELQSETIVMSVKTLDLEFIQKLGIRKYNVNKVNPLCVKPVDGDNYSDTHEPMLYKSPVRQYYIGTMDGLYKVQIPDYYIDYINNKIIDIDAYSSPNPSSASSQLKINLNTEDFDIALEGNIVNSICVINGYNADLVNDSWINYCMTQRQADREMMYTSILTGGIADAGSTAVSAGIGYRSNMERAELATISSNLSPATANDMNKMYTKYGKQAMAMSAVGGVASFSANAIAQAQAYKLKQQSIMNTPGSLVNSSAIIALIDNTHETIGWIELVTTVCDESSYEKYVNTFKKFGYYIGGVIVPNIKSRKFFNYIKTNGAILTGSLNQSVLAKLARIFDNGVTIWHMDYVTNLYDYSKENIERSLIGE